MIDGIQIVFSQIVCLGISDFFGLINRHLRVVVQFAALGIKGHLAEVKKIAISQFIIGINVRIVIIVCKQSICGGLVVFCSRWHHWGSQLDNLSDCLGKKSIQQGA